MAKHNDLRKLFQETDRGIKRLKEEREKTRELLQSLCPHDYVAEAQESPDAPRRICEFCSFEEEGWSFSVLTNKRVRIVSFDQLFRMRDLDFEIEK